MTFCKDAQGKEKTNKDLYALLALKWKQLHDTCYMRIMLYAALLTKESFPGKETVNWLGEGTLGVLMDSLGSVV